jgi:hypothetical protein
LQTGLVQPDLSDGASYLDRLLAHSATIATVSEFSRRELAAVLNLSPASIPVFPNSAEHFAATVPDFTVIDRLGLIPYQFFFTSSQETKISRWR